jgi:hypothetical protein
MDDKIQAAPGRFDAVKRRIDGAVFGHVARQD